MQADRARHTPLRTVRIPDELWNEAKAVATERGDNLSEVLRDALRRYVEGGNAWVRGPTD